MKKQIKNLIICGIALVVLVGAFLLLKFLPKGSDTPGTGDSQKPSESTVVTLWKHEKEDLASVTVQNPEGSYTVSNTGKDQYTIKELKGFTQLTSQYTSLIGTFSSVSAMQKVEDAPSDPSKYGLSSPKTEVTVSYQDGTKDVLHVGDNLPVGTGKYATLNDEKTVYALGSSVCNYIDKTLLSFVDTTVIPAWTAPPVPEGSTEQPKTAPDINDIQIIGGSLTEKIGDRPLEIVMGANNEKLESMGMLGSTWRITSPIDASLNTDRTQTLMEAIQSGVTASSVAQLNPTGEMMQQYGLDQPYAKVRFTRDEETFSFSVGKQEEGGARYVKPDDQEVVYLVSEESLPWISVDIERIFSSLTLLPYIDTVKEVEVTVNGQKYIFASEGEDDDLKATVNGVELTIDNYKKMYQYLLSAPAEEINFDKQTGPEIASIVYRYRKSSNEDTIKLLKVSDRKCVLSVNGDGSFLTRMAYVNRLVENLEKILKDEKPDMDY